MIVFFFVLVGVGLSIVAASQNQSLIQRAQTPVLSACPAGARIFGTPAIMNSVECTIADSTGTPIPGYYVCSNGFVYVPANPTLGTPGLCLNPSTVPACPTGVISVENGTPNSYRCSSQNLVISTCSQGYYPDNINDGVVLCVSQSASCRVDQCYWGDTGSGVFCRESNTVLGCAVGGCVAGQQLKCSNGKLSCETNLSACPITSATPIPISNNCPAGVCVYKAPASSASYACGVAGMMPGSGTCAQADNTCCVTSTYVAKCTWDASKPEDVCTRDGVNRLYVSGKPTRPACCGGLTENGQGTCECKIVTPTAYPTPLPTSIPVQTPKPTTVVVPTSTPKPSPKLTYSCDSLGFSDTFDTFALAKQYTVFGSGIITSGQQYSSSTSSTNRVLDMSIPLSYATKYSGQVGIVTTQAVQGPFRYSVDVLKFSSSGKPFTFSVDNGKTRYGIRTNILPGTGTYRLTSEQRMVDTDQIISQQAYTLEAKMKPSLFIERTVAGTIRVGYLRSPSQSVVMQTFSSISGDFKGRLSLGGPTTKIYLDNFKLSCLQ